MLPSSLPEFAPEINRDPQEPDDESESCKWQAILVILKGKESFTRTFRAVKFPTETHPYLKMYNEPNSNPMPGSIRLCAPERPQSILQSASVVKSSVAGRAKVDVTATCSRGAR